MIISLIDSQIFTCDPDLRFSKEYALPKGAWIEVWRRYKLLDYSLGDLRDFIFIKYGRNPNPSSIFRWVARTKIYEISNPLIKKGVRNVNTEIFGELEIYVINELVKPLKNGAKQRPKSVL